MIFPVSPEATPDTNYLQVKPAQLAKFGAKILAYSAIAIGTQYDTSKNSVELIKQTVKTVKTQA